VWAKDNAELKSAPDLEERRQIEAELQAVIAELADLPPD